MGASAPSVQEEAGPPEEEEEEEEEEPVRVVLTPWWITPPPPTRARCSGAEVSTAGTKRGAAGVGWEEAAAVEPGTPMFELALHYPA